MELLGLHIAIWIVLVIYLAGMLLLGWWSKREAANQEGYLLGNRQFGSLMMVMHSFGAGTHPGAPAGVISKTVSHGASDTIVKVNDAHAGPLVEKAKRLARGTYRKPFVMPEEV